MPPPFSFWNVISDKPSDAWGLTSVFIGPGVSQEATELLDLMAGAGDNRRCPKEGQVVWWETFLCFLARWPILRTICWCIEDLPHPSYLIVAFAGPVLIGYPVLELEGAGRPRTRVREERPPIAIGAGQAEYSTAGKIIRTISLITTAHYPPDDHFPELYQRIVNEQDPPPAPKPANGSP
jgi:hypothetical protein